ncbi:hypothetical protein [Bacillus xiapuensis]|uniref:hypothetical protein n=1 Tax=Bacillus xiapuensis TaxID=2014075 RepID=UPI000C2514C6|nr:hypothetical protein [Bacillus xiapuensis]
MKQIKSYFLLMAGTVISIWLYDRYLGSIPFILFSLYLFYKAYTEINKERMPGGTAGKGASEEKVNES